MYKFPSFVFVRKAIVFTEANCLYVSDKMFELSSYVHTKSAHKLDIWLISFLHVTVIVIQMAYITWTHLSWKHRQTWYFFCDMRYFDTYDMHMATSG